MKLFKKNQIRLRAARSAFTLPEIMISSVIFVTVVVLGMVALQLFVIRAYQLSASKLTASANSLRTLSQVREQIRAAVGVQVGSFSSSNFTFAAVGTDTNQIGSAVEVTFTTNTAPITAPYTIFYHDSANTNLDMYAVDASGHATTTLLASGVANGNCFQAEDFHGNILTNSQNDCTIHMFLQFYETEYVMAANNNTNFYYLESRTTPRAPDVLNN